MKIIILLIALFVSPLNTDESHEVYLAMPHTHQTEAAQQIGKMSRKFLQFVK